MRISLCIPLYNEEKIILDTAEKLSRYMRQTFAKEYEIIFVSDGSTDSSMKLLSEIKDPCIRVLSYPDNRGKGCAVRTGILEARGEMIVFTDCDLAYGTEVIGEFYRYLSERNELDALIGSRSLHPKGYEGYTLVRKLISKTYLRVLSVFGGLKHSDSQTGIKAFRREMAHRVFSLCEIDRFAFDFEAILLTEYFGGKIGEYPVQIVNHRPSTIRFFRDSAKMLRDIAKIKRRIRNMKKEAKAALREETR